MNKNEVILVDEQDHVVGTMEKMEAHRKGVLHRAFSIFIFDSKGRMLMQQRAAQKYHGGLLWTNACCSHPYPDEAIEDAAQRRLMEELGFAITLKKILSFTYKAEVENNLIEHEFDHVLAGEYMGAINPNAEEVADYCYLSMDQIKKAIQEHPDKFTSWFRIVFPQIESWWHQQYNELLQKIV